MIRSELKSQAKRPIVGTAFTSITSSSSGGRIVVDLANVHVLGLLGGLALASIWEFIR